MSFEKCSFCKTPKDQCPSLEIFVNICSHPLCVKCINFYFNFPTMNCPVCSLDVPSDDYHKPYYDDILVDRDMFVRSRIMSYYNQKEEDFSSLSEYNDYLEEIETIIHNLVNNINVKETNKRVEAYKRKNRELIKKNKSRKSLADQEVEGILQMEREEQEIRLQELMKFKAEQNVKRQFYQRELIEELMSSNKDADEIFEEYGKKAADLIKSEKSFLPIKSLTFSTGVQIGNNANLALSVTAEEQCYEYKKPNFFVNGPMPPTLQDIKIRGYVNGKSSKFVKQHVGGHRPEVAAQRLLEAACNGLYHCRNIN